MSKRIAVIDLGTNTCNLLIAEYQNQTFQILFQSKEIVKLGKGGIGKDLLTEGGLQRAVWAIRNHQKRIEEYGRPEITVVATSAVRDAKNRDWFQQELEKNTGIRLQVISGEREAELIFKGAKLAFNQIEDHSLILDIGGGSNEFILIKGERPAWRQSFPLGMARVIEQIPLSDPISPEEIKQVISYFKSGLSLLWEQIKNTSVSGLIGCSGAFDTVADLIDQTAPGTKTRVKQEISVADFERIYQMLIRSTMAEREKMKEMDTARIEMIVPSVIFIKLIVDRLNIHKICQTDFALREGILYERIFS
jgi:exopolyphosphatase / guanosine-5'-triphosphate,3'-diphosphate pyrophosphatase